MLVEHMSMLIILAPRRNRHATPEEWAMIYQDLGDVTRELDLIVGPLGQGTSEQRISRTIPGPLLGN